MKKSIFLAFTLLLGGCGSVEQPEMLTPEESVQENNFIPLNEALENADSQFAAMFKTTRANRSVRNVEMYGTRTRSEDDALSGLYVVNYDEGFAIMSADRRRPSVLALSEEGEVSLSDTVANNGLSIYLKTISGYGAVGGIGGGTDGPWQPSDTIQPVVPVDPTPVTRTVVEEYAPTLQGFMKTAHQGGAYNMYCLDLLGRKAMAGCVPVSIAQYCSWRNAPTSYQGYTFNWKNILDVARFIEIMGRPDLCNVKYGELYTDCSADYILNALRKIGCDAPSSLAEWDVYVTWYGCPEFNMTIAGGYNEGHLHTWIIDGGKQVRVHKLGDSADNDVFEVYLHCVWGEKGNANGYFLFSEDQCGGRPYERDENTTGRMPTFRNLFYVPMAP